MIFEFTKATKAKAKARIGLVGPSGSGKTYSALAIAQGFGGKVALIDTEHGSASKYAGEFEFDTLHLDTFSPDTYCQAIQAAEQAGYDVLIIDSLSHAWSGKDGALEQVDKAAARSRSGNSFAAWRDVTPMHNRMIEAIVGSGLHIIATMRAKTDYIMEQGKNGKMSPRKVGLAPVQRDGMEYEFDVIGDLDLDHNLIVTKTRCSDLDNAVIAKPDSELGETIKTWLSDGIEKRPEHWSDKIANRQRIEKTLFAKGIPTNVFFKACNVSGWADMHRFEGTGSDAVEMASERWQNEPDNGKLFDDSALAESESVDALTNG